MKKACFTLALLVNLLTLTAQDRQISFDSSGKILSIDAIFAEKIGIFSEYPNFHEATLFQTSDSTYSIEIVTRSGKDLFRTRKLLTEPELEALRLDISERTRLYSPKTILNQEGRSSLLLANSVVSYGFYGTAVSSILSSDFSPAIYFLSSGAGFVIPLLTTGNKEVTLSQGIMTAYGQTRGILHGMLLPMLVNNYTDFRITLGFGLVGSIAEGIIGYKWAGRKGINDGQASTIGMYSDFGMLVTLGASHALGFYEGDHAFKTNIVAASLLAGAVGGLLTGNAISKKDYYSQGDASVTASAALAGGYLPLSLMSLILPDDMRLYTAVGTLGTAAGLFIGDRLAKKHDFSNRQAMFASLSMAGGGLIGAGIGQLISSTNESEDIYIDYDPKWIVVMSAIGASAGLGLAILNYTRAANRENKNLSLKLQLNPMGFMNSRLTAADPTGRNAIPILIGKIRL